MSQRKGMQFQCLCETQSYGCTIIYFIALLLLDIWNIFTSCYSRACFDVDPWVSLPVSSVISLRWSVGLKVTGSKTMNIFKTPDIYCPILFQKCMLPPVTGGRDVLPCPHRLWGSHFEALSFISSSSWLGYSFRFQHKSYFFWDIKNKIVVTRGEKGEVEG